MNGDLANVDPRVALAVLAASATAEAVKKIWTLIHQNKDDDAALAAALADLDARIARRS